MSVCEREKEKEREKREKENQPINLYRATQSFYPERQSKLLDRKEKLFSTFIIRSLPSSSLEAFGLWVGGWVTCVFQIRFSP